MYAYCGVQVSKPLLQYFIFTASLFLKYLSNKYFDVDVYSPTKTRFLTKYQIRNNNMNKSKAKEGELRAYNTIYNRALMIHVLTYVALT